MSKQFINFNGEIYPAEQPVMTIGNRGFRYGDGLFESMRLMKGEIKFLDLHAARLQRGMQALKMTGHSQMDAYFLKEKVEDLARRNKTGPNARARLTVFRDAEGLYTPLSNRAGYAIEVTKMDHPLYRSDSKGLIVDVFTEMSKPVDSFSNHKTCNSLIYVMAGVFRNQNALNEVIILNQNGNLCEGMSSNIFVVYDKQIYTPALSEGCIAGVMRQVVMDIAKESKIPLVEAQINPAILKEADEIFLTNASSGIQWVMGYNNTRYFNRISKVLLDKLNKQQVAV